MRMATVDFRVLHRGRPSETGLEGHQIAFRFNEQPSRPLRLRSGSATPDRSLSSLSRARSQPIKS